MMQYKNFQAVKPASMDDTTEKEQERAYELFEEFTEGLDELNDELEVINEWNSTGRGLGEENAVKRVKKAEGLYRMATNVLENTDYELDTEEADILRETEEKVEQLPEYIAEEFDASYSQAL